MFLLDRFKVPVNSLTLTVTAAPLISLMVDSSENITVIHLFSLQPPYFLQSFNLDSLIFFSEKRLLCRNKGSQTKIPYQTVTNRSWSNIKELSWVKFLQSSWTQHWIFVNRVSHDYNFRRCHYSWSSWTRCSFGNLTMRWVLQFFKEALNSGLCHLNHT